MTVQEMIEKLLEFPANAEVQYMENHSDLQYGIVDYVPMPIKRISEDNGEEPHTILFWS